MGAFDLRMCEMDETNSWMSEWIDIKPNDWMTGWMGGWILNE
jgi:hypothetical protein